MHHCKDNMDLQFFLSEQQFSIDILVIKLSVLFYQRQASRFICVLRYAMLDEA